MRKWKHGSDTLEMVFGMKNDVKVVKSYCLLLRNESDEVSLDIFSEFTTYTYVQSKEDWYGSYLDVFCFVVLESFEF